MLFEIIFLATLTTPSATYRTLFPDQTRVYTFSVKASVGTGTVAPVDRSSAWTLEGNLNVQVFDEFSRARFSFDGLKSSINSDQATQLPAELVQELNSPWEAGFCQTWLRSASESLPVLNLQRAVSYNFLVSSAAGTSVLQEPCLYGTCISTYSQSGTRLRKYTTASTRATNYELCVPAAQWQWRPVRADKSNFLFTAERDYDINEKGLQKMELKSSFQHNTYAHILGVFTDMTIRLETSEEAESVQKMNLTEYPIQYHFHTYSNPSNGIWNRTQNEMKNGTYEMLLEIAKKGIDADNIVRNATLIHSLDFIDLLNSMSQLDYESLHQLFEDVLGTSYELETSRNIFYEVLPYVRNDAAAKLIKYLVIEQKTKIEDAVLLTLLRKLPYNIMQYSRSLLEELEVFTKLGPEYPQEIRHAGILSFATLVYKAMEANFDQHYFDDIYDKYLRMFNYCPQYIDRLVWLQGLINIGKNGVNYLDEIYTDVKKDRHERLWAALASTNIWKGAGLENSLPILMNATEHSQLRIAALHAILRTPLDGRDFHNVHEYISSSGNQLLQKFWYSTIKNLENNKFFDKYKAVTPLIPFLSPLLKKPGIDQWATNNVIISQGPPGSQGPSFQMMTVGGQYAGAPEMVLLEFSTGGDVVFDGALYIIAEGVTSNVFKRIKKFNSTIKFDQLLKTLKEMKIEVVEPEKVHIDILIKVFDKTVYATHIDQEKFDSWNLEDVKKSIEDFVRFGSHINQQMVYYPLQMVKYFPTEIGTPIRLHSTVVSFTSLRGNVTAPSVDGLSWRNDLHVRYQGTSVTSLSTDGFLPPSEHSVRIQQSMVVHLPIKLDVKLSLANRSIELTWTNPAQNGGVAMHSRTQLATVTEERREVKTISPMSKQSDSGLLVPLFDCEDPEVFMSEDNVLGHLRTNILSSLKSPHILMNTLPLFNPTVGTCGLILPARQLQTGNQLDLRLKMDHMDWLKHSRVFKYAVSYSLRYYKQTEGGEEENYFSITGKTKLTNELESIDLSMEYKFLRNGENFIFCLRNRHRDTSPFNIDFIDTQMTSSGELAVLVSEDKGFVCASEDGDTVGNPSKLMINYEIQPQGEKDRDIKIHAEGNGTIFQILSFIKNSDIVAGPVDLKGIFDKLIDKRTFSNDAFIKERNGELLFTLNNKETQRMKADILTWILPKYTLLQTLTKLGVYHVCQVNRNSSFSGKQLVIGDCTSKPSFAIIESNSEDEDSVIMISNENVAEFAAEEKRFEKNDEFGIQRNKHDYILSSRTTGVKLLHQEDKKTVILIPQPLLATACGSCLNLN